MYMKAKKILELIVNYQLSIEFMGFVLTPKYISDEVERINTWTEWWHDSIGINEVWILDSESDFLYYCAREDEYELLDRMNCIWVANGRGERMYLFKVE